jgi:hypothetical protein
LQFLGVTEAEQPKGIEVVKDCIRKLKLDQEIRRAEGGGKIPKVIVIFVILEIFHHLFQVLMQFTSSTKLDYRILQVRCRMH